MTATPDPVGVVVTLTQIYETLRGVETKVGNIETKIDALATSSLDHEARLRVVEQAVPTDLGKRLAVVEEHRSWSKGAVAAISSAAALFGGFITAALTRLLG